MSTKIASILTLSPTEDQSVQESLGFLRTLTEWVSETVEAIKDTPLLKLLGTAGDAAKEWSGTVKAAGKIIEKLSKETSPQTLGWLACTIAYRRAASDAITALGRPASRIPYSGEVVAERLKALRLEEPTIMEGFSLASPSSHPFLKAADRALVVLSEAAGYDNAEQRNLLRRVRANFKAVLQDVLSGEQKEKFANFTQWLQLDTDDQRLNALLVAHTEMQRAELEDQPALGIEPFSISDVYIESECGILSWKAIRDGQDAPEQTPIDPFCEDSAERVDLAEGVMSLLSDKKFNDAIIIQGAPGAGKSTFTKNLCVRLRDEGLIPIRIPLQHLRVDINIFDALQDVIGRFSAAQAGSFRPDLLPEKVFTDKVTLGNAVISPYIFIFDGWDEISLSAAEGFQQRVERLLDAIRQTFFNQSRNRVRVILTGRPSRAIGHSNFLRDNTPILTVRPIRPEQLKRYVAALGGALAKPAFNGEEIDKWTLGDLKRYQTVLEMYETAFPAVGDLEVLGYPLLAHLAMKVMANFKGDLSQLIIPPTTLYRHLVDLTCKRGGKYPIQSESPGQVGRIEGKDLRALLHGTALAITAHGSESIPEDELEFRLDTLGVGKDIFRVTREHPISNLMISFYFKSVHEHAGAEFLHKSFREYLAAEAIIEVLKEYGRLTKEAPPEKDRHQYWQDFEAGDPRYWLTRKLGEVLSPQWLSKEIVKHLSELIAWEIQRAKSRMEEPAVAGAESVSTDPISATQWCCTREGLADLWDWWGEGVHLRPQPLPFKKDWKLDARPYVAELVEIAMRRSNYGRAFPPRPLRTATVDAHLGYGLFQLNCFIHACICEADGWLANELIKPDDRWKGFRWARRYQVVVSRGKVSYVQFAPSSNSPTYFRNYVGRINGAGVAPLVTVAHNPPSYRLEFPSKTIMRGVHLAGTDLRGLTFSLSDMTSCNLLAANLSEAQLAETKLSDSNLRQTHLFGAHLFEVTAERTDVTDAHMFLTDLRKTRLLGLIGLSQKQINGAIARPETELPTGLTPPVAWTELAKDREREEQKSEAETAKSATKGEMR